MFFGVGHVGRQMIRGVTGGGSPAGATLDLTFMYGVLDPSLTFTRGSTATYFDSSGTMQTAAMNILLWSADFTNAAWVASSNVVAAPVVTGNVVAAPDGTVTADRVVFPAVAGASAVSDVYQVATTTASPFTFSVWMRGNVGGEQLYISVTDGGSYYTTLCTLTTSWQRFSVVTPTLTAAGKFFFIGMDLRDGAETSKPVQTVYVWGAQAEANSAASNYSPTTTAANGAPRFDYDPVTHAALGLLIEEQRTNILPASGDLTQASWSPVGSTITAVGPDLSPNGANFMNRMAEATGTSVHYVADTVTLGSVTAHTGSFYAKAGTARYLQMAVEDTANNGGYATFDLQAGVISQAVAAHGTGTVGSASIQAVGNGIYRCTVSATTPSTLSRMAFYMANSATPGYAPSYAGNAANSLSIWGCQLEAGAFPTSYIPTTAAAVTRSADLCTITPANMGWFTPPGGSWMTEIIASYLYADYMRIVMTVPGPSGSTEVMAANGAGGQYDGVTIIQTANVFTAGTVARIATTAIASGQGKACTNGGAIATATMGPAYPSAATNGLALMSVSAGTTQNTNGYLRRVRYWPRVLSNAELQSVTT